MQGKASALVVVELARHNRRPRSATSLLQGKPCYYKNNRNQRNKKNQINRRKQMESKEIMSTIENDQSMTDQNNGWAEIADSQSSIVNRKSSIPGRCHHRRRGRLGRRIFSKEVLYPVLFAITIGAVLIWRLFAGL
jgi:hypothetical protein